MFKSPFSFKGRIRRMEYGLSLIIYNLFSFLNFFLIEFFQFSEYFSLPFILPLYYFLLAQGAKRCHDRGNSGWYQIIPFYGLWMLFADSEYGINRFGENPKGLGNRSEIDTIGSL